MRKFSSCPALLLFLLLAGNARMVFGGQAVAEVVGPTQQIPRTGFKTWSLFLICAQDWVAPEKSADLANLYRRFKGFGDAIGKDNVAVWFWKQRLPITDARLADNVDVPRSVEYCRALRLVPSEGPFLVITDAYPELTAFPQERAVYALGAMPSPALATLLNKLTDQLVLGGKVAAPAAPSSTVASAAPPLRPRPQASLRPRPVSGCGFSKAHSAASSASAAT